MNAWLLGGALALAVAGARQDQPVVTEPPAGQEPLAPTSTVADQHLSSYFEGALMDTDNGQGFIETPGYRRLLEHVARYSEAELQQKAEHELDVKDALARPDEWRGKLVRLRGILAGLKAERFDTPLAGQVDRYRAVVTEADGSEGVVVDFMVAPPKLELMRDVVDIEAVFYRTVRYESLTGLSREAPYLVARNLRRPPLEHLERSTALDLWGLVTIGAAVVFIVVRVVMYMSRRGASAASAASARAMSRAIHERAHGGAPPPAPTSKKS